MSCLGNTPNMATVSCWLPFRTTKRGGREAQTKTDPQVILGIYIYIYILCFFWQVSRPIQPQKWDRCEALLEGFVLGHLKAQTSMVRFFCRGAEGFWAGLSGAEGFWALGFLCSFNSCSATSIHFKALHRFGRVLRRCFCTRCCLNGPRAFQSKALYLGVWGQGWIVRFLCFLLCSKITELPGGRTACETHRPMSCSFSFFFFFSGGTLDNDEICRVILQSQIQAMDASAPRSPVFSRVFGSRRRSSARCRPPWKRPLAKARAKASSRGGWRKFCGARQTQRLKPGNNSGWVNATNIIPPFAVQGCRLSWAIL